MTEVAFDPLPCPHCDAQARVLPHPTLLFVCGACGGPRIPSQLAPGVTVPAADLAEARAPLLRARVAQRSTVRDRLGGMTSVGTAVMALLAAVLIALVSKGVALAFAAFAFVPLFLSFQMRRRAAASEKEAQKAVEAAWAPVLGAALERAGRPLTARELGAWLGLTGTAAEAWLVRLASDDRVRVDVGDDGELRYGARVRIGEPLTNEPDDVAESTGDATRGARS